jgi:hypothetical protein
MSIISSGHSWKVSVSGNGTRYRRSFKSLQDAEIWQAQAKLAVLQGQIPPGLSAGEGHNGMTIAELADTVYRQVWAGTRGEVTADINASSVVRILGADREISSITTADGDAVIAELRRIGNSNATINRKMAALSRMMSFAHDRGWITRKPKFERLRESDGRVRFLTKAEYTNIREDLAMHDCDMADLVVVLVETGLRLSEALNLRWEDIDMTASHIRVWQNKSDKPRSVPLSTAAWNVLCPRSEQGAGPFVMMSLHSVRHKWDAMKKRLGLQDDKELTPHCCRHTFASWLVQRGVPIFTVKELCGHKCIEVTMRYAHLKDEDRTNAITAVFG